MMMMIDCFRSFYGWEFLIKKEHLYCLFGWISGKLILGIHVIVCGFIGKCHEFYLFIFGFC
jgi:hypothetical protein